MAVQSVSSALKAYPAQNFSGRKTALPDFSQDFDKFNSSAKNQPKTKLIPAGKFLAGLASLVFPGLGQIMNGDTKKGALFMIGDIVLSCAAVKSNKLWLARGAAVNLAAAADAYKNAE